MPKTGMAASILQDFLFSQIFNHTTGKINLLLKVNVHNLNRQLTLKNVWENSETKKHRFQK
jgi:hypothetical protein